MRNILLVILAAVLIAGCAGPEGPKPGDSLNHSGSGNETPNASQTFAAAGYEPFALSMNASYPMLYDNMRWDHMPLRVYLDLNSSNATDVADAEGVRKAFQTWENATNGTISFIEAGAREGADVVIGWQKDLGESGIYVTAGTGSPQAYDTGLFNLSESADITLVPIKLRKKYRIWTACDQTEAHELGHILGLYHAEDKQDLMYEHGLCGQSIKPAAVSTLDELYRIRPLPELSFKEASVSLDGAGLHVSFTVANRGLVASPETTVLLKADGKPVESYELERIEPGNMLIFEDVLVEVENAGQISLTIDPEEKIEEMGRQDNVIVLLPA
jgi:hypothetical protein